MIAINITGLAALILVSPILFGIIYLYWQGTRNMYKVKRMYQREIREHKNLLLECNEFLSGEYFRHRKKFKNSQLVEKIKECKESSCVGYGIKGELPLGFTGKDLDLEFTPKEFREAKRFVQLEDLRNKTESYWEEFHHSPHGF